MRDFFMDTPFGREGPKEKGHGFAVGYGLLAQAG